MPQPSSPPALLQRIHDCMRTKRAMITSQHINMVMPMYADTLGLRNHPPVMHERHAAQPCASFGAIPRGLKRPTLGFQGTARRGTALQDGQQAPLQGHLQAGSRAAQRAVAAP